MRSIFQKFKFDESGATLVEYGVALVVAIIVGGTALSVLATETSLNMTEAEDGLYTDAGFGQ